MFRPFTDHPNWKLFEMIHYFKKKTIQLVWVIPLIKKFWVNSVLTVLIANNICKTVFKKRERESIFNCDSQDKLSPVSGRETNYSLVN